ncbi:IS66 family transposase [Streptococcus danieliae]|uniref:IS66 family transposase n=1 Tax=Streptococcus danieliae TaxID=747656 RepID=UPI003CF9A889
MGKLGLPISRKEIANWHIKSAQYYLKPLYDLLSDILREQSVLHADETSYRVLESDTDLTYFWTFLSGKMRNKDHTLSPQPKAQWTSCQGSPR